MERALSLESKILLENSLLENLTLGRIEIKRNGYKLFSANQVLETQVLSLRCTNLLSPSTFNGYTANVKKN